LDCEK
jgi:hypothetical protein